MKAIKPNSIDAIVTDPPYNLHFMGKSWDKDLIHEQWLSEAFKVLKPGASMLVMGGTRTFHRLACAIEDTGFIIKDTLMWIYGSGFPKAQDLGKMIDKRNGKQGEVVGKTSGYCENRKGGYGSNFMDDNWQPPDKSTAGLIVNPSTPLAKHWDGFKIGGIKPAYEPIIWAVKPPEGSYIDNVLKWGVGAVNVDECRISLNDEQIIRREEHPDTPHSGVHKGYQRPNKSMFTHKPKYWQCLGRFPANIILDEEAGKVMDEMSGNRKAGGGVPTSMRNKKRVNDYGIRNRTKWNSHGDSGGASRFFYCAKASRSERNEGLEGVGRENAWKTDSRYNKYNKTSKSGECKRQLCQNNHPTVKPVSLMSWLIKLITCENQIVLDPFLGSGTTGISAIKSNRKFVGIEKEDEYLEIAQKRILHYKSQATQMNL